MSIPFRGKLDINIRLSIELNALTGNWKMTQNQNLSSVKSGAYVLKSGLESASPVTPLVAAIPHTVFMGKSQLTHFNVQGRVSVEKKIIIPAINPVSYAFQLFDRDTVDQVERVIG